MCMFVCKRMVSGSQCKFLTLDFLKATPPRPRFVLHAAAMHAYGRTRKLMPLGNCRISRHFVTTRWRHSDGCDSYHKVKETRATVRSVQFAAKLSACTERQFFLTSRKDRYTVYAGNIPAVNVRHS